MLYFLSLFIVPCLSECFSPTLGAANNFAVVAYSTSTNTGLSKVFGDLGVFPGTSVTGYPPGELNGALHSADIYSQAAQASVTIAYNALAEQPCSGNFTESNLGGLTFLPGVYCFTAAAELSGAVYLDAGGDKDAVFIFKMASSLLTTAGSQVFLTNGARACGVYWQLGSSATFATGTAFQGNVLVYSSITLVTGATHMGGLYASTGAVTLDSSIVIAYGACGTTAGCSTNTTTTTTASTTVQLAGTNPMNLEDDEKDVGIEVLVAPIVAVAVGVGLLVIVMAVMAALMYTGRRRVQGVPDEKIGFALE